MMVLYVNEAFALPLMSTASGADTLTMLQPDDFRVVFVSGMLCRFKQHCWSRDVHMQITTCSSAEPASLMEFDER